MKELTQSWLLLSGVEEAAARSTEELGHSRIIGSLVQELGDSHIVLSLIQEFSYGDIVA